jgi:hypothetical protein
MDLAKSLAFSAVGGLVVGAMGCASDGKKAEEPSADSSAAPAADTAAAAADASGAKACCKGLNECKGKGGCKTADHECAGKNDCGKKGGCSKRPDMPECAK